MLLCIGRTGDMSIDAFRERAGKAAREIVEADNPKDAAFELHSMSLRCTNLEVAKGLWNIWGRITDEWTHPDGSSAGGAKLARESADELLAALGDDDRERAYCEEWIYRRLDIVPLDSSGRRGGQ